MERPRLSCAQSICRVDSEYCQNNIFCIRQYSLHKRKYVHMEFATLAFLGFVALKKRSLFMIFGCQKIFVD